MGQEKRFFAALQKTRSIRIGYAFIGKSPRPAKIMLWPRTEPSTASTCDTDQISGDTVPYNGDTAANMDFCGGWFVLIA
jgi:hypothetical protein